MVFLCAWSAANAAPEGFETYQVGQSPPLQGGWSGDGVISEDEAAEGNQSLKIAPGQSISHPASFSDGVSFWDFYVLPDFGDSSETPLNVAGAEIGFTRVEGVGRIMVSSGTSSQTLPQTYSLLPNSGSVESWIRITVRIDWKQRIWDLFVDGRPVAASVKLGNKSGFSWKAAGTDPSYLDAIDERRENPIFTDADLDGMPDAEEVAYGMNPFIDDREADIDGDGIKNVDEIFASLSARNGQTLTSALSNRLFVDNLAGDDSFSGKASYVIGSDGPKRTLKAAMSAASSGAVIYVQKGTGVYDEGSRGAQGKELTIKTIGAVTIK